METNEQLLSRRRTLKVLTAALGSLPLFLQPQWEKPVITIGSLPVFAQGSLGNTDLEVILTWDTGGTDLDLHAIEPSLAHVYWYLPKGPTTSFERDDTDGYGPERIFARSGGAAPGVYQVFIVYAGSQVAPPPSTNARIEISVFKGSLQMETRVFSRLLTTPNFLVGHNVAEVTFPKGLIIEKTGIRNLGYPGVGPKKIKGW
jgi:hypothetical protein